jgi:hypothetical protein
MRRLRRIRIKRRGVEKRIVLEEETRPSHVDLPLLKAIARGRKWAQDLFSGRLSWRDRKEGSRGRPLCARTPVAGIPGAQDCAGDC